MTCAVKYVKEVHQSYYTRDAYCTDFVVALLVNFGKL